MYRRTTKGFAAVLAALFAVYFAHVYGAHKTLTWDSNIEADMKEYRVYACAVDPCIASGTALAVVAHVATQPTHSYIVPHSDQYYVVYAVDTALNVSGPSSTVFANVIAPNVPSNPRIQ